jgi:hypothetical protein
MLHGEARIQTKAEVRQAAQPMVVQLHRDGRKEAEWLIQYMPGAVRRFGLA